MDRSLKKLSRIELLELMVSLSEDYEDACAENEHLKRMLASQRLPKNAKVGSIAEAALMANGYFDAAQRSADEYLREIKHLRDELALRADTTASGAPSREMQQRVAQLQSRAQAQAQAIVRDAQLQANQIVAQARAQAQAILGDAQAQARAQAQAQAQARRTQSQNPRPQRSEADGRARQLRPAVAGCGTYAADNLGAARPRSQHNPQAQGSLSDGTVAIPHLSQRDQGFGERRY